MAKFAGRREYRVGNLVFEEQQTITNIHTGTVVVKVYKGRPQDVAVAYNNRANLWPDHIEVRKLENGTFWELHVKEGVQLFSTWTLDSVMHEVPLVASAMGIELDYAFPGWARFIEVTIDNHFSSELRINRFDTDTIKSSALFETDGATAADLNYARLGRTALDNLAVKYAETYIMGTEVFFQPRWVIKNTVTISATANLQSYPVLYDNVNVMLSPFWMAGEGIVPGEIIPAGTIVPGVKWWHKQPFSKVQTSGNQFIINREYWGLNHFIENLYDKKGA